MQKKQKRPGPNCKKIIKILIDNNCNTVVLSNRLKQNEEFVNFLLGSQMNIIQGKKLFKLLTYKIIENQCLQNNIKLENTGISIIANSNDEWLMNIIRVFSKKFKTLNIVTNNINNFKIIENNLFEEDGTIITVTANKKKALANSKIIINVDFPQELINKFTIYENAIIINLEEKIKINKKRFSGKILNDYKISFKKGSNIANCIEDEKYMNFDIRDLAEVYIKNEPEELKNIIYLS